jgi:hypothetical protein
MTHIAASSELSTVFDTYGNRWGSYDRINFFPSFKRISEQGDENDDNRRRLDRTKYRNSIKL